MGNTAIMINEKFLDGIKVVQIYVTFEQVWCVGPHTITVLLAAVNTLKGHMEETWCITAVLGSHTP